jgi:hypothetical protein
MATVYDDSDSFRRKPLQIDADTDEFANPYRRTGFMKSQSEDSALARRVADEYLARPSDPRRTVTRSCNAVASSVIAKRLRGFERLAVDVRPNWRSVPLRHGSADASQTVASRKCSYE